MGLSKHGCVAASECCSGGKCQRDQVSDTTGSCRTCVAETKHGCTRTGDCCKGNKCQKDTHTAALGMCDLVGGWKGQRLSTAVQGVELACRQPSPPPPDSPLPLRLQCIDANKWGCAKTGDCCDLNVCQRNNATDTSGTCISVSGVNHPALTCLP